MICGKGRHFRFVLGRPSDEARRDSLQPLDLCFRERSDRSSCLPVRPSVHGISCAVSSPIVSAPAYPPRAGPRPYRGCRRGSTQARSEWHSRHRKAAHGLPVVLATGVATRKPHFPPWAATGRASETRRVPVTPAQRHAMRPHRRSRQRAAGWTPRRAQRTRCTRMRIGGLGQLA